MLTSVSIAIAALISLVAAQGGVPSCATSCITLPTQCNGNPQCICSDQQWISDISCCIYKACDTADQTQALSYAKTICTPVGVTLPSSASCNGTSDAATTSSASSGMSSSTTGSASSGSSVSSAVATSASAAAGGKIGAQEAMMGVFAIGAALL